MRLMSGSGPFAPIFKGVWQSWQAAIDTKYRPRSTRDGSFDAFAEEPSHAVPMAAVSAMAATLADRARAPSRVLLYGYMT
jgi:hypothetical protein